MITRLSIVILSVFFGPFAGAASYGRSLGSVGVDGAVGLNSDFGLFGGGLRLFPAENWDVHLTAGVDGLGQIGGVGTSLYADTGRTTCLFVFTCTQKVLIGATALQNNRGSVSVTSDGVTGKYRISSGYAASVVVGNYNILASGLTYGVQAGYRAWWQRPRTTYESGTNTTKGLEDVRKLSRDSLELALTLGWRF